MKFVFVIFFIFCSLSAVAQSNVFPADRFLFINLKKFIKHQEKLDSVSFIVVEGLTNEYLYPFKTRNQFISNGIYKLRSGVTHKPAYIFEVKNGKVTILSDYSMKALMEEYERMKKLLALSCSFKTKCLENMIYLYDDRVDMANSSRSN